MLTNAAAATIAPGAKKRPRIEYILDCADGETTLLLKNSDWNLRLNVELVAQPVHPPPIIQLRLNLEPPPSQTPITNPGQGQAFLHCSSNDDAPPELEELATQVTLLDTQPEKPATTQSQEEPAAACSHQRASSFSSPIRDKLTATAINISPLHSHRGNNVGVLVLVPRPFVMFWTNHRLRLVGIGADQLDNLISQSKVEKPYRGMPVRVKDNAASFELVEEDIPWDEVKMAGADEILAHIEKGRTEEACKGCIRLRVNKIFRSSRGTEWRCVSCSLLDMNGSELELGDFASTISVHFLDGFPSDIDGGIEIDDEIFFFAFNMVKEKDVSQSDGRTSLVIKCPTGRFGNLDTRRSNNLYFVKKSGWSEAFATGTVVDF